MGNICTNPKAKDDSSTEYSSEEENSRNSDKKEENSASAYTSESSEDEKPYYKFLLVGAGEAGKSTFFKIVTNKTNKMYSSESDLLEFKESIHENIIETMRTVINKCNELKDFTDDDGNYFDCRISEVLEDEVELLLGIDTEELDPASVDAIEKLLKDDGFNTCLKDLRSLYYIPDGAVYFLDQIARIGAEGYVPTFEDIINCRDRTTGVTHEELPYKFHGKEVTLDLYDVGGQRAERKAWKKIFNNVGVIIFVMAISEFDQKCIEDNATDRLVESLLVLKVLNDSPNFVKTPILLLITKTDQLESKLAAGKKFFLEPPASGVIQFDPYTGDNSFEDVKEYILQICKRQISGEKTVVPAFKNLVGEGIGFEKEFNQLLEAAEKERK